MAGIELPEIIRHWANDLLVWVGFGTLVGLLSKALALQRAIEQGLTRFDFLRGPEPYKYDLGARDLAVHRCVIRRA